MTAFEDEAAASESKLHWPKLVSKTRSFDFANWRSGLGKCLRVTATATAGNKALLAVVQ